LSRHLHAPGSGRRAYAFLVALLGVALLLGVAWAFAGAKALPPRAIAMATGPEGGAYQAYAARYRDILARHGLEVRLQPTAGDVENLALLRGRGSGVSVAFLQAGTTSARESTGLVSLGSMFDQAVWIFRRGEPQGRVFAGPRVSIGPEGSGTRATMTKLLRLLGSEQSQGYELLDLPPARAADALQAGRIDGMALVTGWDSPIVRRLIADPAIGLVSFARADAYVALEPSLEKLVLPRGVGDLARDRPPRDVTLLAARTSLVVRDDLHPAVQYLLLVAASEIHGGPGIFQKAGQFPAAQGIDVPLSDDARRFYRSGRPFLHRYLPYWLAVLAERLLIVLVPLLGLVAPLLRTGPDMYRRIVQRRIVQLYGELKLIETELENRPRASDTADLAQRAASLESRAGHLRVPLLYSPLLYTLKQHIRLVWTRLEARA
jgi:TRAP-type uncharacterized transport system substrate-binding protein